MDRSIKNPTSKLSRLWQGNFDRSTQAQAAACLQHGPELDSTGRGMPSPRAEDDGWPRKSIRQSLNCEHLPQGGLRASRRRTTPIDSPDAESDAFRLQAEPVVDSPPQHGTRSRNTGRSLGRSGNATGPGFDSPQVHYRAKLIPEAPK